MPAVTHVVLYDDMDWPGTKTEAAETVRVVVVRQPVGGGEPVRRTTELFLSGAHAAELSGGLDRWFEVGHKPGPAGQPGEVPRTKGTRVGPPGPGSRERRLWKGRLRAWSDNLGLVNKKDPRYPAWQTTTGKHTYPAPLEDGFILHEDGREDEAMAMIAEFLPAREAA